MSTIPTFLVVGAAKTGTSWLHQCIREHPNVFVPELKEINFFSWHYDRPDWYRSLFSAREHEEEAGEISPSYMVSEETPKRINDWNPGDEADLHLSRSGRESLLSLLHVAGRGYNGRN